MLLTKASAGTKKNSNELLPFYSNGCSLPNVLYDQKYNECCMVHDFLYWKGGSLEDKNQADVNLANCITKKGGWDVTGLIWKQALDSFGLERWGVGWKPRRKNLPLNAEENSKVLAYENLFKGKLPLVTKSAKKINCNNEVINTLKNVTLLTKLNNFKDIACYNLENETDKIEAILIFSIDCYNGYFVHQKTTTSSESIQFHHNLAGYGECRKKIKIDKLTDKQSETYYQEIEIKPNLPVTTDSLNHQNTQ